MENCLSSTHTHTHTHTYITHTHTDTHTEREGGRERGGSVDRGVLIEECVNTMYVDRRCVERMLVLVECVDKVHG